MARSGINRGLMWLRKTLQITEETESPQVLSETLRPVIDVFGWDLPPIQNESVATAGVTVITRLPAVPEGESHLIFACDISHDDGVGSKDISIRYENEAGNEVSVHSTVDNVVDSFLIAMDRPILVRAGDRLIGRARSSIAAGSDFTIRAFFYVLQPGEYLAGSPWG